MFSFMEESKSYHDWELQFRKKPVKSALPKTKVKKLNSLRMTADEFGSFLKDWAKENLPPK